jgi:hypothetical protein
MRVWCVIVTALLVAGCGGGGSELPVNGIVTMDNEPLAGASVTFFPEDKAGGTGGTARTGTDGKFVILGPKGQRGLVPGQYKVTVSKASGGVTDEPVIAAPAEEELRKEDLPAIYSDRNRTKLSYTVTGDGQPIEIKLDSKAK